jgi:hypothetical protein
MLNAHVDDAQVALLMENACCCASAAEADADADCCRFLSAGCRRQIAKS